MFSKGYKKEGDRAEAQFLVGEAIFCYFLGWVKV